MTSNVWILHVTFASTSVEMMNSETTKRTATEINPWCGTELGRFVVAPAFL